MVGGFPFHHRFLRYPGYLGGRVDPGLDGVLGLGGGLWGPGTVQHHGWLCAGAYQKGSNRKILFKKIIFLTYGRILFIDDIQDLENTVVSKYAYLGLFQVSYVPVFL